MESRFARIVAALALAGASGVFAAPAEEQEGGASPGHAPYSYFSGTVTKLEENAVTVRRRVLGRPAQERVFQLDAETQVEGELRESARVTVAFTGTEDVNVARHIIVRDSTREQRSHQPPPPR